MTVKSHCSLVKHTILSTFKSAIFIRKLTGLYKWTSDVHERLQAT